MVQGKNKGNAYERKIAKELSFWMFDDKDFLKRHASSGMDKSVWCGDIVPAKQLPDEKWNRHFPFLIECKSGYVQHQPTFWRYSKVSEWFKKAHLEGLINNQPITLLTCQFKNQRPLLITNYLIDPDKLLFNVAIPISINGSVHYCYVYFFNDLLKYDFYDLFETNEIMQTTKE